MIQNDLKSSKVIQNHPKWFKTIQNDSKSSKIIQNHPKWLIKIETWLIEEQELPLLGPRVSCAARGQNWHTSNTIFKSVENDSNDITQGNTQNSH